MLDIAVAAADAAGAIIREGARDRGAISWHLKSHSDFVTDIDTAAERAIREVIRSQRPDAEVIGEELSPDTVPRGAQRAYATGFHPAGASQGDAPAYSGREPEHTRPAAP